MHDEAIRDILSNWEEYSYDAEVVQGLFLTLEAWGVDIPDALNRFLEDEGLYLKCLLRVTQNDLFITLPDAVEHGNLLLAFECAHTLKGTCATLNLAPLFEILREITENLREGQIPEKTLMERFQKVYGEYCGIVEEAMG